MKCCVVKIFSVTKRDKKSYILIISKNGLEVLRTNYWLRKKGNRDYILFGLLRIRFMEELNN